MGFLGSAGGRLPDSTAPAGGPPTRAIDTFTCSLGIVPRPLGLGLESADDTAGGCEGAGVGAGTEVKVDTGIGIGAGIGAGAGVGNEGTTTGTGTATGGAVKVTGAEITGAGVGKASGTGAATGSMGGSIG